ncbi:GNAT family N-acetyltransferase [Treponema phagedenis]|uniref:GNAT family N-acetyltransferase n=1 Tax=Treponema phagedenis TaxID=162 RepID=UPI00046560B2|nr:GNAT family N-acetyltransferase [Treponema phagedenis]
MPNNDTISEVNSIFEQPWWWNAVTNQNWDVIEVKNGNELIARLPYYITKRLRQNIITLPPLTQTTGPWIKPLIGKPVNNLARRKEILDELIEKIPKKMNIDLYLNSENFYILPFRWHGFKYEPTFSYRIKALNDVNTIFSCFREAVRRQIRKAEKEIVVRDDSSIDVLLTMQDKTFKRQDRINPYPKDLVSKLDESCCTHNARKFLTAIDAKGVVHAAAYFVYDTNVCYYLMGGADPEFRSSGAQSLLLWEGIKFAATVSKQFDFEGSNVEDIERAFRSFSADFVINYRITRLNPLLSFADYIKPKIKHIIGYKI